MLKNTLLTVAALSYFLLSAAPATAVSEEAVEESGLLSAVTVALKHTPGSVLEAELESKDGRQVYEVDIVHGDHITETDVDIVTRKVINAVTDDPAHRVKREFISNKTLAALKNAKITLPEAIAKAEKAMGAKAEEAEFKFKNGRYVYEIETTIIKHKRGRALVDVTTGDLVLYNKDAGSTETMPPIL